MVQTILLLSVGFLQIVSANGLERANTQRNLAVLRKTAQGSCILGSLWYFPVQGLTEKELSPSTTKHL